MSGLSGLSGPQLADLLGVAVLGFSVFIAANKRLELSIVALALQAVAIASLAALAGLGAEALGAGGDPTHVYWSAGMVLAVKAGVVPLVLWYFAARSRAAFAGAEARAAGVARLGGDEFNSLYSLVAALGLIVLAYWSGRSLSGLENLIDPRGMTLAIAMSLIGLLVMVGRRNALAQVLGLAVLENGVFLASVAATRGMPLAVEAAVLADLVLGAMIMGYLSYRIHRAFDTLDTGKLNTLRG
ncbi:MAG: hypothetical protein M1598_03390 [Actinobacteria bacterium]|nr:hypothetical protein [Actinomycetota bacterium]